MTKNITRLSTLLLVIFSSAAMAHPGHGMESVSAGFMHPLTGWDHLLVMLAVGLWAGRIGGTARWVLPVTFMSVMALGAIAGMSGIILPGLETGIAASVLAMGVLVALASPMTRSLQLSFVALFAFMHGAAHGVEMAASASLMVLAGMLTATGLLHLVGVWLSSSRLLPLAWQRGAGVLIAMAGIWMLAV